MRVHCRICREEVAQEDVSKHRREKHKEEYKKQMEIIVEAGRIQRERRKRDRQK